MLEHRDRECDSAAAARFSWNELVELTGGCWLQSPAGKPSGGIADITDDSRNVSAGALFVAVPGTFSDGHRHVAAAVADGAAAVCIQHPLDPAAEAALQRTRTPCLQVADTLIAFQELARAHRRRIPDLAVIAVTGSCGKTSTKEMLAAILETAWPDRVLKTEGNTNNHFGVPRNLLRLRSGHRAAVIELGSNHSGEIGRLAAVTAPDIGVITNIGRAHIESFGDLAGVAREKGSLFAALPERGTAVLPADAPHREILSALAGTRTVLQFGADPAAAVQSRYLGVCDNGYRIRLTWHATGATREFLWDWGGNHQACNAAAAAAAATALGLDPDTVVAGLRASRLPQMRMEIRVKPPAVHWVNDAYNANPDSMRASILWFREISSAAAASRRILVLGDMLELGSASGTAHRELLAWIRGELPDADLVPVGVAMRAAAAELNLDAVSDAAAARTVLRDRLQPNTWVLLKGSRAVGLEAVLPS